MINFYNPHPDRPIRVQESAQHMLVILSHRFTERGDPRSAAIAEELGALSTITPGLSYHALRTYWLVAMTAPPPDDLISWAMRATALTAMFEASIEGEDLYLDLTGALALGQAWLDALSTKAEHATLREHVAREISAVALARALPGRKRSARQPAQTTPGQPPSGARCTRPPMPSGQS